MMEGATRRRLAKASVYLSDDDAPFLVAETPREVAEAVRLNASSPDPLVELTLANDGDWNSKPLFIRVAYLRAVSPPKDQDVEPDT